MFQAFSLLTFECFKPFIGTKNRRKFAWSILPNKSQRRGIPQRLIDKRSHLFICTSLEYILTKTCLEGHNNIRTSSPCYNILPWQVFVFCRLIKNRLEWFLPIKYKKHTQRRSTNLIGRHHSKLYFSLRRGRHMPNTLLYDLNKMNFSTICLQKCSFKIFQDTNKEKVP